MKEPDVLRSSALLLTVMLLAAPARSEEGPPLVSGQRLRVTAVAPGHFTGVMVGSLVKVGPDSLSLADPERAAVTEIHLSSITRLEVSHGRRRHTKQGLLIGVGVGILGGIAVGSGYSEVGCGQPGEAFVDCPKDTAAGVAVFLGSAGIGAWLGHRWQTEGWSELPVERLRVTLRPERGGARGTLTFSF